MVPPRPEVRGRDGFCVGREGRGAGRHGRGAVCFGRHGYSWYNNVTIGGEIGDNLIDVERFLLSLQITELMLTLLVRTPQRGRLRHMRCRRRWRGLPNA
jgi:hypothetical protein